MTLLILRPRRLVGRTVGDQPGVIATGVRERLVVGELKILNNGFPVHELVRGYRAALGVSIAAFFTPK